MVEVKFVVVIFLKSYSTPCPLSDPDPSLSAPNEPTFRFLSCETMTANISRTSLGTVLS